jgi:predicted nucleotidyltransferase
VTTYHGIEIPLGALGELCRRYGVRELAIFGSAVREDFHPDSDIDLLVEFQPEASVGLLDYVGLQHELADLLGRKVDLVSKAGLKPLIRDDVLRQAQILYAA